MGFRGAAQGFRGAAPWGFEARRHGVSRGGAKWDGTSRGGAGVSRGSAKWDGTSRGGAGVLMPTDLRRSTVMEPLPSGPRFQNKLHPLS